MAYSSYAPTTLPKEFWNPETHSRVAEMMRSMGIEPPPVGVIDPMATKALGEGLYAKKDWKGSPLAPALVMMGGAALGGAIGGGGGIGGFGGAGSAGSGFMPGAAGGGVGGGIGSTVAKVGMRAGLSSLLSRGGGGGGSGGGDMAAGGSLLEQLAARLMEQSDPLRQMLMDRSAGYLQNGVGSSPQFSAFKAAAEPQFAQARQNIIGDSAPGGGLTSALAGLQANKARMLTEARGGIDQQELGLAERLATGGTGQAVSGLGAAGNLSNQSAAIQAQIKQADSAQDAAVLSALGQGAGAYFGSKD
jgi:hypothetical protein